MLQAINESLHKKEAQLSEARHHHHHHHTIHPSPTHRSRHTHTAASLHTAASSQVLAASNLDPSVLGVVSKKLDDVLDSKNGSRRPDASMRRSLRAPPPPPRARAS